MKDEIRELPPLTSSGQSLDDSAIVWCAVSSRAVKT